MKIEILAVGRVKKSPLKDLFDTYQKRMRWTVQCREFDTQAQLAAARPKNAKFIVLDETGQNLSSTTFAKKIEHWQNDGDSHLVIAIGGADGWDTAMREKADLLLAFGAQTWPHQLVRIMLIEQLYRAQQILAGHPYHRD